MICYIIILHSICLQYISCSFRVWYALESAVGDAPCALSVTRSEWGPEKGYPTKQSLKSNNHLGRLRVTFIRDPRGRVDRRREGQRGTRCTVRLWPPVHTPGSPTQRNEVTCVVLSSCVSLVRLLRRRNTLITSVSGVHRGEPPRLNRIFSHQRSGKKFTPRVRREGVSASPKCVWSPIGHPPAAHSPKASHRPATKISILLFTSPARVGLKRTAVFLIENRVASNRESRTILNCAIG